MAFVNLLTSVKAALSITDTYHDATITEYIDEVNNYLLAAGVDSTLIGTAVTAGVVTRGVSDLWNYGAGSGVLSPYFYERAIQLTTTVIANATTTTAVTTS